MGCSTSEKTSPAANQVKDLESNYVFIQFDPIKEDDLDSFKLAIRDYHYNINNIRCRIPNMSLEKYLQYNLLMTAFHFNAIEISKYLLLHESFDRCVRKQFEALNFFKEEEGTRKIFKIGIEACKYELIEANELLSVFINSFLTAKASKDHSYSNPNRTLTKLKT